MRTGCPSTHWAAITGGVLAATNIAFMFGSCVFPWYYKNMSDCQGGSYCSSDEDAEADKTDFVIWMSWIEAREEVCEDVVDGSEDAGKCWVAVSDWCEDSWDTRAYRIKLQRFPEIAVDEDALNTWCSKPGASGGLLGVAMFLSFIAALFSCVQCCTIRPSPSIVGSVLQLCALVLCVTAMAMMLSSKANFASCCVNRLDSDIGTVAFGTEGLQWTTGLHMMRLALFLAVLSPGFGTAGAMLLWRRPAKTETELAAELAVQHVVIGQPVVLGVSVSGAADPAAPAA